MRTEFPKVNKSKSVRPLENHSIEDFAPIGMGVYFTYRARSKYQPGHRPTYFIKSRYNSSTVM